MHESERNRLRKRVRALLLASDDMHQAKAAVRALEQEHDDHDLVRALETAIVVSYARAFTPSSLHQLDSEEHRPEGAREGELHDLLLRLRDKVYAHTDIEGGRSATFDGELLSTDGVTNPRGCPPGANTSTHTAARATPIERPTPNCFTVGSAFSTKLPKTQIMMSAAATITRAPPGEPPQPR